MPNISFLLGRFGVGRFGFVLVVPVLAVTGLVMGILGLRSQKRGTAIGGIITSSIGVLVTLGVLLLVFLFASQL